MKGLKLVKRKVLFNKVIRVYSYEYNILFRFKDIIELIGSKKAYNYYSDYISSDKVIELISNSDNPFKKYYLSEIKKLVDNL